MCFLIVSIPDFALFRTLVSYQRTFACFLNPPDKHCLVDPHKDCHKPRLDKPVIFGPPGVLGILGEWTFFFRELGSTGNYLRGAREQAHNFGDLGSLVKKQKNKEKPPFCLIFLKNLLLPQIPLLNYK